MHDEHFGDARAELLGYAREDSAPDGHVVRVDSADGDDCGGHEFSILSQSTISAATRSRGRDEVSITRWERES